MYPTPAGGIECTDGRLNAFLDRVLTTFDRTVRPHLDLKVHHNATHTQPELLELLTYCGIHRAFANDGAKTRRQSTDGTVIRSDKRCPISRALGRHLRGLDYWHVTAQFDSAFEAVLSVARTARLLPRMADLAIDVHDWLFYGDAETPMVADTHFENGTDLAFKYVTACIVIDELRLTVAAEPVTDSAHLPWIVNLVLTRAADWVDIRRVYLDREFYEVRFLQVFEAHDVGYVVRARQFPSLADGDPAIRVEHGYLMGGSRPPYDVVTLTRFCVPHAQYPDKKQSYFVTNLPIDEDGAPQLANAYRRQWGVETSYRVIKDFSPRSRSTYFVVRVFYYLFVVVLYNLWVLVNALLTRVFGPITDRPLVTAGVFRRMVRARWQVEAGEPA